MVLLRNARLAGGDVVDVLVEAGVVAAVRPATAGVALTDSGTGEPRVLDLSGYLLLPAPAEPHAHLDKALTWDEIACNYGDLPSAVRAWTSFAQNRAHEDFLTRARNALGELVGHGTTAVRTHVNAVASADPLRALRALLELRHESAAVVDMQVVFLASWQTPDDVVREALEQGADLLGGAPHAGPDPRAELRRLLTLADGARVGLDLHTDEQLEPSLTGLHDLAAAARGRRVTASHCVALSMMERDAAWSLVTRVAASGLGVVALPATNLYLQGRGWPTSPPRGITAVRALLDAGVPLAGGSDNLRDPFNPVGRGDPLEAAALLVTAGHLTLEEAYAAVSSGARRVLGLPVAGTAAGERADLLAIRATSLSDAIGRAPQDRIVMRGGDVIARSQVHRWSVL